MYSRAELIELLNEQDPQVIENLYRTADQVRKQYVGDQVHLRGLIEFSNYCKRDCLYCGLRRSNRNASRYRLTVQEIFDTAVEAKNLGLKTVVMQAGEDGTYSIDDLCSLVSDIKTKLGLAITLSIGERSYDDFKRLREAGADRSLVRFETSDPKLFAFLKPDSDYRQRFQCLEWLRELGYQVGSGTMVGLPGQTVESMADDILKFNELELDMIGMGPFIPHPETPLDNQGGGTIEMILKMTALTRITTRNTHIPATTATGTIDPQGRQRALKCGANVMMPNITALQYRPQYEIYPGKICIDEGAHKCRFCMENMAIGLGRSIGMDEGHSLKMYPRDVATHDAQILKVLPPEIQAH